MPKAMKSSPKTEPPTVRPDPFLNELSIIGSLSIEVTPQAAETIQTAALLTIMAGFDRRILRDEYIPLASASLALHTRLGCLAVVERIADLHNAKTLTKTKLEAAIKDLMNYADRDRREVQKLMIRVSKCPTSADTVN